MRRLAPLPALLALALALAASPAQGASAEECKQEVPAFGICALDARFVPRLGDTPLQAGSHPEAAEFELAINTEEIPIGLEGGPETIPTGEVKDLRTIAPPGFLAAPTAVPQCSSADFIIGGAEGSATACPAASAVGVVELEYEYPGKVDSLPVYNLAPAPGVAAKIGFVVFNVAPVTVDLRLDTAHPHNGIAEVTNVTQVRRFFSATVTLWGSPADPSHDAERGRCLLEGGSCEVPIEPLAFLTLPTRCEGPLLTRAEVDSWQDPGDWIEGPVAKSHADGGPRGPGGCDKLAFEPEISSQPTTEQAEGPTGLRFGIDVDDPGITDPDSDAASQLKKAVVTLPEGVTLNPSIAEGLGVCTPAQYGAEGLDVAPGQGCPGASKVGSIEVESPLLEGEIFKGQVYVAEPYENPFGSLVAIYMTIVEPERGVFVKLAGRVEPDPLTGRLVTTVEDIPQLPFAHFRFRFREGARGPLITPPSCDGDPSKSGQQPFSTEAELTPWAAPDHPVIATDSFQITQGVGGGPCPPGGTPPFEPGLTAGTLNAAAGAYSPFFARLTRRDGDQDMTRFSFELPPGLVGKIAGVGRCSEAQIAAARLKSGTEELTSPSCPPGAQIGRVAGGAGVGSQLTYVDGSLYLAGPIGAAPLSIVAIVPAVAGPFDVGNVVTRVALKLNPKSAQVEVDGDSSEPIPHILAGIPLRVRDVRVLTDRPEFTLNPTDCSEEQVRGRLWGGGANAFSTADDSPTELSERFQAFDCAVLGFGPRLNLTLKGGTRRGAFPALRLRYVPRKGDANLGRLALLFPRSAFIEQGHFRTICTRVQFAAGAGFGSQCPIGSIYGRVKIWTPLLEEPLAGPVYLRSSDHNLPDVVLTLNGPPSLPVHFEVSSRIDSVKGRLRAISADIPDAPITRVALNMQGGQKGLIVNSRGLCSKRRNRARANLHAQNARRRLSRPVVRSSGCAKRRARGSHGRRR